MSQNKKKLTSCPQVVYMVGKCDLCLANKNNLFLSECRLTLLFIYCNMSSHLKHFQVFAVQHVDVCMFSNGKFKNVVADVNESYQIKAGESYRKEYSLLPLKGKKNGKEKHLHLKFHKIMHTQLHAYLVGISIYSII